MELQKASQEKTKSIHVVVATSNNWVPFISAFTMAYPHIMLSCTTLGISQLLNNELSFQYSFVLADHNSFLLSQLDSLCLYEEQPIAILPVNHPLAKKDEILLTDLTDEILFLPMTGQSFNMRIKKLFHDHQLPLKHTHECSDSTCKSMVAEGRGVSFTSSRTPRSSAYPLAYVPIKVPKCHWEQRLYWDSSRQFTQEELTFKEFLLDMYNVPRQHH